MTMSQLLLAGTSTNQLDALCDLAEIHEQGAMAYSDNIQRGDNPYRYGSLESDAWDAGWSYANASDDFAQEAMRA